MEYSFQLIGVSPVLSFFNLQYEQEQQVYRGAEYLGAYHCTLDAFLNSIEDLPGRRGWNVDRVVDSVISFWLHNEDQISRWKRRLEDARGDNLLVARIADLDALKVEFEALLDYNP